MVLHKRNSEVWESMRSDCSKCSGLCCTALFFSKTDGFSKDKTAGEPCTNLLKDYRCEIHSGLAGKNMRGCIGYDCFGAGQQVTENVYKGKSWCDLPEQSQEIFDVFTSLFQIYQIRFFLTEAFLLTVSEPLIDDIQKMIDENIKIANSPPQNILSVDIDDYRARVNFILRQICGLLKSTMNSTNKPCPKDFLGKNFKGSNMSGLDLSTKLLIAADFSGCRFDGTIFLGADTRDTNFSGADLREAVFLTQGQINSARGNRSTRIPEHLEYPVTWKEDQRYNESR